MFRGGGTPTHPQVSQMGIYENFQKVVSQTAKIFAERKFLGFLTPILAQNCLKMGVLDTQKLEVSEISKFMANFSNFGYLKYRF